MVAGDDVTFPFLVGDESIAELGDLELLPGMGLQFPGHMMALSSCDHVERAWGIVGVEFGLFVSDPRMHRDSEKNADRHGSDSQLL